MIFLVRHGETTWNREGRLQGHRDSPLTEKGVRQALAYASLLRRQALNFETVELQTSPLLRARRTASIIGRALQLESGQCRTEPLLVEHGFGKWEGLTEHEIEARFPGAQRERHRDHWSYVVPGGESYQQVFVRAMTWLRRPRRTSATILVTHAKMSRVLRGAFLDLTPEAILRFKHPQDRIYRLDGNRVVELKCPEVPPESDSVHSFGDDPRWP